MKHREREHKTTIGGQALIEGILMRGPKKTSIVVRKTNGELVFKDEEVGTVTKNKFLNLPFVRGVVGFWNSMKYGVGALTYSAEFLDEGEEEIPQSKFEKWLYKRMTPKKVEKLMMGFAVVLGIAMPIGLFMLLPTFITGLVASENTAPILRNLMEGAVKITVFLAFIIITSKQKDIKRTYMYHGAEHKAIACYESGEEMNVENVRHQSRLHPRCGTSFLFVVIIISILVTSMFTWSNTWVRMVLHLALLPLIVGISYEINRWVGRHDNLFSRILRAPGLFLQRFTTNEPDDSMIEVAIEALNRVVPENKDEDRW